MQYPPITMIKTFFHKKVPVFAFLLLTFFTLPQSVQAVEFYGEEAISIGIYENLTPSIVLIEANLPDGISTGTGCVVHPSGIILTSLHVISDARNITVTTNKGTNYKAEVVALLKNNSDLALLKINTKENLVPVRFGDSNRVKPGQRVLTIGNPFGFNGTLTTGIVSRIDYPRNKIQTDAAINPGCSGGPLINLRGEIIGINQSIYNPDNNRSYIGIGFAVPVNDAKEFVETSLKRLAPKIAQW